TKNPATETARLGCHDIAYRSPPNHPAVILKNIGFPRRDHKTDLVGPGPQHSIDQVFADRARALCRALEATADRQQLLGEGQRLNACATACGRHNTPHRHYSPNYPSSVSSSAARRAAVCREST